ncbi:ThuA domain-containing protein [Tengunoibacter tsumagoiensis]|uniref:Trehalose utilization protein ThuA n=1 Tax=Tengunoibacter tsumagoiensis TaxID=2014871 RepID=A0A402AAI6_9CHLR|nr:ThuA domain-containing protein [Tengunoibacter tsumagoiensis]GCE15941.1 trehalose utilization protein ThuA [Tengunoibacter tsumagoiensis]
MTAPIRVTIWNEYRHERHSEVVAKVYPEGIHGTLANALGKEEGYSVRTATLDEPEHGLTQEVLDNTDVLIWWGHMAHGEVRDEIVDRVQKRVLAGMGLVALHSAHYSKIFRRLLGTECDLKWREADDHERLWVIAHGHPITEGIGDYIELEHEEMYGEPFGIPEPETLVFVSWFSGGEVFRSGCCYTRGQGRIFYFRPGHETIPTYHNPEIQRVISNSVRWAAPTAAVKKSLVIGNTQPLEK